MKDQLANFNALAARLVGPVALVLLALLVLSAAQKAKRVQSSGLTIDVRPFEDDQYLIKDKEVKRIIQSSFTEDILTESLGQLDLHRMELVLEQDPFVQDAEVWIDAKHELNVSITQRRPMVRVIDNNGLNYYIDKNGIKMPLSAYAAARVPVLTGEVDPYVEEFKTLPKSRLNQAFTLIKAIEADPFLAAMIEQIDVQKNGEIELIPKIGRHTVIFGTAENINTKLRKLKIFYKEGLSQEGWNTFKSINLKFNNQVVCKSK